MYIHYQKTKREYWLPVVHPIYIRLCSELTILVTGTTLIVGWTIQERAKSTLPSSPARRRKVAMTSCQINSEVDVYCAACWLYCVNSKTGRAEFPSEDVVWVSLSFCGHLGALCWPLRWVNLVLGKAEVVEPTTGNGLSSCAMLKGWQLSHIDINLYRPTMPTCQLWPTSNHNLQQV